MKHLLDIRYLNAHPKQRVDEGLEAVHHAAIDAGVDEEDGAFETLFGVNIQISNV